MNTDRSSENSKAATPLSQQMDRHELKRRLLISIGKVCLLYVGLYIVLFFVAGEFRSTRYVSFGSLHAFVILLSALAHLMPFASPFFYGFVIIPIVGGCINMLVLSVGGLLGGRAASRRDPSRASRGVYLGAAIALAMLVLVNVITMFCLWYFNIKLSEL